MAPHLQHLPVLCPLGAERPAAVCRMALRGDSHGQLVRQDGVSVTFLCLQNLHLSNFYCRFDSQMQHLYSLKIFSQVPVRQMELSGAHPHTETLAPSQWHPFIGLLLKHTVELFRLSFLSLAGLVNIIC